MENSLTNLLDSKLNTGTITVKIAKKLDNEHYIIADQSSYALLDLTANPAYSSLIDLDKTYKLMKCNKNQDTIIPSSFKPIKSKKEITTNENTEKILQIEQKLKKTSGNKSMDKTDLKHIEENTKNNTYISNLKVIIASVSRPIDTNRGTYKIATIVDANNNKANLNLYDQHIHDIEVGQIYNMNKIKKISIETEGEQKMRLCANKFSILIEITEPAETDLFEEVILGDNKVNGTIEAIIDLKFYESCTKHLFKLDTEGNCPACADQVINTKQDFTGKLYITTDNDELEIQFFKRQMGHIIKETDDEEETTAKLDSMIDKTFSIQYKKTNEEQNILVKIKENTK